MKKLEKFRLKSYILLDYSESRILAKIWGNEKTQYKPGDCYVLAIKGGTNPQEVPGEYLWREREESIKKDTFFYSITHWRDYSHSMTIKEIEKFLFLNRHLLGRGVNNCYGLKLEEEDRTINFDSPIYINSPLSQ